MSEPVKQNILLVEDEVLLAMNEKMQLEQYGYAVRTVTTGEQAVEAIQTASDIDLILMDINLGNGIDGTEAAEIILRERDIPIVFLSSHTEPEIVEKTEKITTYGYVVKNSNITVLDASIKMAFRLFEAKREVIRSEERYHQMIEHSPSAIALHEMIYDDNGAPIDYRFLAVNSMFEEKTGVSEAEAVNSRVLEVFPNTEQAWIDTFGALVKTGERLVVEDFTRSVNQFVEVTAFRTGENQFATVVNDITERKQAEEALHQERNLLLSIIDSIPDPIYVKDTKARKQIVNRADCHSCGFDSKEDLIGKDDFEIYPPEIARSFFEDDQKVLKHGERVVNREEKLVMPNGETGWQLTTKLPMYDQHGQITGLVGIGRDITERKRAEEKYQSLFNYSNDAIFVHEIGSDKRPGRIIEVNEQACRLYQYSREELLQMSMKDIASEKTRSLMPSRARQLIEERHLTFEAEDLRRDGSVIPVEVSAYSYRESGKDFVVASVRDITERKMVEKEIQKAKDDLQTISDNMLDLVSVTDMEGNYKFAGSSHAILGYEIEYLMGKNVMDFVHPDDLPGLQAKFVDFITNKKTSADAVYRNRCADGSYLWFETFAKSLFDNDGNPKEMLFNTRDITDRKHAEEVIQKQLSEKETLLREGHHRVKNNIATIESLLSLQIGDSESPEVKAALREAMSRVQSIRVLYDKLLISKDLDEISIRDYVGSLLDSLITVFDAERNITVETHLADFEVASRKAVSIGIIINELLTNVFKYAFVERDDGLVSVSIDKQDGTVTLIVQDNGVGFDERSLKNESSGFGLTIVKMLVEQSGGTYSQSNDNGAKSVVQFEL